MLSLKLFPSKLFVVALILLLSALQLSRVVAFAGVYGGIEHDSGWFLGVSRLLAEEGAYAAMVATLTDAAAVGAVDVDQKFNIQGQDGRVWFFTGNGTGPASIIPNAVIIWLFGSGFWALRAGPLLFYSLLLLATSYAVYRLGGIWSIVLLHLLLFCYPRLSIFLGYEAMGEVTALFYVVMAYLIFAGATQATSRRYLYFLAAGLVAGLAVSTKLLALLSISSLVGWAGLRWLVERKAARLVEGGIIAACVTVMYVGWELIQLLTLTYLTSFHLYLQHLQQRFRFILDDGSGLGARPRTGADFLWRKFFMLAEITAPERWVIALIFAFIVVGGLLLLGLWQSQSYRQHLLALIYLGWGMNTLWFVGLAKTGWPRHFWFGLMLAVLLLSTLPVALFWFWPANSNRSVVIRYAAVSLSVSLLALLGWGALQQPYVWRFYLDDDIVSYWLDKRFEYVDMSGLPWILIPRSDQDEVITYIQHMPPEANVYYPTAEFGHKAAEIPVQTGRIQYPFARRGTMQAHPADIVLIPPSLLSIWRYAPQTRQELRQQVAQACPKPVLENDNYIICLADDVRVGP